MKNHKTGTREQWLAARLDLLPPEPDPLRTKLRMSAFALQGGVVHHTYSAYSRGLDALWGMYPWFDRAPRGRNESGFWLRRHDEYAL